MKTTILVASSFFYEIYIIDIHAPSVSWILENRPVLLRTVPPEIPLISVAMDDFPEGKHQTSSALTKTWYSCGYLSTARPPIHGIPLLEFK